MVELFKGQFNQTSWSLVVVYNTTAANWWFVHEPLRSCVFYLLSYQIFW